jgi:hypothetical protein
MAIATTQVSVEGISRGRHCAARDNTQLICMAVMCKDIKHDMAKHSRHQTHRTRHHDAAMVQKLAGGCTLKPLAPTWSQGLPCDSDHTVAAVQKNIRSHERNNCQKRNLPPLRVCFAKHQKKKKNTPPNHMQNFTR